MTAGKLTGEYEFETTCIDSTAALIDALCESEREIKYRTFRRLLGGFELDDWAVRMGYVVGAHGWGNHGPHLCNDYAVRYFRGEYDGLPALFIRHSAVEHVWTRRKQAGAPVHGAEAPVERSQRHEGR